MISSNERDALLTYLEFLLVHQLIEPIIAKHIKDDDVVGACYDGAFAIIEELKTEIGNHCFDMTVDASKKTK
jgi:hypothetical protein